MFEVVHWGRYASVGGLRLGTMAARGLDLIWMLRRIGWCSLGAITRIVDSQRRGRRRLGSP